MNWKPAIQAVGAFTKSARDGASHALKAGLHLLRLRSEFGVKRGGDRRSKPLDAALIGPTWAEIVEAKTGMSDDQVARWVRAARGYLATGQFQEDWWTLPAKQQAAILKGVKAYTAGKSVKELAAEWDRLTAAAPVLQGGDTSSNRTLTTEEQARHEGLAARSWWQTRARETLDGLDARTWAHLQPAEIAAVATALEQAGRALRKHVPPGVEPAKDFLAPAPIKPAKGRVVDSQPQLPPPAAK